MRVKICGITNFDQARAVAQCGATDLGFICVAKSARYIAPEALTGITQALLQAEIQVGTVGVFVNTPMEAVGQIARQSHLKTVQLHSQETLEDCQRFRQLWPGVEIIKAIRVRGEPDLELADRYAPWVDALLLDAYHPHHHGGTGQTLEWEILKTFRPACPWFLAGGLTPKNVQTALIQLFPQGIDLSSGVEDRPGVKNLTLVRDLFRQLQPFMGAQPNIARP